MQPRPLSIALLGPLSIVPTSATVFSAEPFYGARSALTVWAANPDASGELPESSPHSEFNADMEYTFGPVLFPTCPTLPRLGAFHWGRGGPHRSLTWTWTALRTGFGRPTRPSSALEANSTRFACAHGIPDATTATVLTRTGLILAKGCFEPDDLRSARSTRPTWRPSGNLWAACPWLGPPLWRGRTFSATGPRPSSLAEVGRYGPRLVAAALQEVERQLLTLDMARA